MSNYKSNKITFGDLKKISDSIHRNSDNVLVEYLNNFDGDNVFEKFRNVLISWNYDVSNTLNINFDDKQTKIALSYIILETPTKLEGEIIVEEDFMKIGLDIPKKFDTLVQETLPIYSLIQYINISDKFLNLIDIDVHEKKAIIDILPGKVYNSILQALLENKSKIVGFNNPVLEKFKFNFLTNDPYYFLKNLFDNFGEDYYKDVIFHLSKRIDPYILMDSTPLEIEYYIQKYSEEMKTENDGLTI